MNIHNSFYRAVCADRWLCVVLLLITALYVGLFFLKPSGENWGRGWNMVAFLFYATPVALVAGALALWRRTKVKDPARAAASFATMAAWVFPVVCVFTIWAKA